MAKRIQALAAKPPTTLPWRTVRDAIADLPDPRTRAAAGIRDHKFQDGAKVYPGHTGSPLDQPAKTIRVDFKGAVPDTFKVGAEVIVEGGMADTPEGKVFTANTLITKCPSKYEKQNRG